MKNVNVCSRVNISYNRTSYKKFIPYSEYEDIESREII